MTVSAFLNWPVDLPARNPAEVLPLNYRATVYDFYATVLHLLGLDHEQLTYYHNGARRRLTDVHGHVLRSVLK